MRPDLPIYTDTCPHGHLVVTVGRTSLHLDPEEGRRLAEAITETLHALEPSPPLPLRAVTLPADSRAH
ncbi:MAG: hypothetical protein AAF533_10490 [Acidobacteriota bacterium]